VSEECCDAARLPWAPQAPRAGRCRRPRDGGVSTPAAVYSSPGGRRWQKGTTCNDNSATAGSISPGETARSSASAATYDALRDALEHLPVTWEHLVIEYVEPVGSVCVY
jgi:hypothetical protein